MQQRSFDPGLEHSSWEELESLLKRRHGLLDGVVFSGGEPCLDPALPAAVRAVKEMGYEVGLHTGGSYPARLAEVLPDLSWVGLDVKAVPADGAHWAKVTGVESAQDKWTESLGLLLASGVPFECRTTAHPDYFSEAQLLETAAFLQARNVKDYALQICRKPPGLIARFGAVDPAWPSESVLEKLRSEVLQGRHLAGVVVLLIGAVDICRTAVNDRLLLRSEICSSDKLFTKGHNKLGFQNDRVCTVAVILIHIHCIDVIVGSSRNIDYLSAHCIDKL